jgi:hypothetical protein
MGAARIRRRGHRKEGRPGGELRESTGGAEVGLAI